MCCVLAHQLPDAGLVINLQLVHDVTSRLFCAGNTHRSMSAGSGMSGYSGYSGATGITAASAVSAECLLSFEEFDESVQVGVWQGLLCLCCLGSVSGGGVGLWSLQIAVTARQETSPYSLVSTAMIDAITVALLVVCMHRTCPSSSACCCAFSTVCVRWCAAAGSTTSSCWPSSSIQWPWPLSMMACRTSECL